MSDDSIPTIETDGTIRLGQFLKLAQLAESGSQARELIVGGDVLVQGDVEMHRGRQLAAGMLVEVLLPGGTLSAYVG